MKASFRPFEQHRVKFAAEVKYLTSHGVERALARKDADRSVVASSRSQMIEVCSESSFQPLLQLYLFLPTLIMVFNQSAGGPFNPDQNLQDWFNNVSDLQFFSILTSCITLSWSFNFHQAVKKKGALGCGTNPIGRVLLLLSNILQISGRLVVCVMYAYSWGDGNFWPMFVGVLVHIGLMSVIYYQQTMQEPVNQLRCSSRFQSLYQSIINGISNLYMFNLILPLPKAENQTLIYHRETFQHQAIVDFICMVENVYVIVMASFLVIDIPVELLLYGIQAHLLGLLLKYTYYYRFHIWSPILALKMPCICEDQQLTDRIVTTDP